MLLWLGRGEVVLIVILVLVLFGPIIYAFVRAWRARRAPDANPQSARTAPSVRRKDSR